MILSVDSQVSIYFGDKQHAVCRHHVWNQSLLALQEYEPIAYIKQRMQATSLVLLRQMHTTQGVEVTPDIVSNAMSNMPEGDYSITNIAQVGLGVYTADCLPIVFYSTKPKAIGICHAGWPGTLGHIASKTVQAMQHKYRIALDNLWIFFGAAAQACCYEVSADFIQKIEPGMQDLVIRKAYNKYFFDLPRYNTLVLGTLGIPKDRISHAQDSACTICNPLWHSHRREGAQALRQVTVVALHSI